MPYKKPADAKQETPIPKESAKNPSLPSPSKKAKPIVKSDSAGKTAVKNLQNAILKFKESLEQLDVASKQNPGEQYSKQQRRLDSPEPDAKNSLIDFTNKFLPGGFQLNKNPGKYNTYSPVTHEEYVRDSFQANIPLTDVGRNSAIDPRHPSNEQLGGTNPMGNFLVNNYIPSIALSYADVDSPEKTRNKIGPGGSALKQFDFRSLVESIGHIGTPKTREDSKEELRLKGQIKVLDDKNSQKYNAEINTARGKAKAEYDKAVSNNYPQDKANNVYNSTFDVEKKKVDAKYSLYLSQRKFLQSKLNNTTTKLDKNLESKNPGGEESIDGIYHIRTSNALKIIGSIVQGFLTFAKDIGQSAQKYTQAQLNQYLSLVNIFDRSIENKNVTNDSEGEIKGIQALANHIYVQSSFIKDEFINIIQSDNVKTFITQKDSFMSFNKTNMRAKADEAKKTEQVFTKKDPAGKLVMDSYVNYYKNNFQDGTSGIKINMNNKEVVLSYESLWTTDNLADTYKNYFGKKPTKEELGQFLDKITETMNNSKRMNSYTIDPRQIIQPPQQQKKPRTPGQALSGGWYELTGKPKN